MTRAAVLIGANRTGKLPVLQDAVAGARRMEQWALSQGMARHRVLLFTDENGAIDVGEIRRAIRKLVDSGSITQLIVYFAGHGVNIRYGEYWLLTDAPEDASAAVNVEGSMVLARRCGIPHVVFISDACRTAAEGVQAQGITGTEIFPNDPVPGPENPVDIFFGTTLGRPALEVKDPAASSAAFKAIYTGALLDAMSGKLPKALAIAMLDGKQKHVVRPRPLKALMLSELPKRLAALQLSADVIQVPDARITSDDDAWLASLEPMPSPPPSVTRGAVREAVAAPLKAPDQVAQERLESLMSTMGTGGVRTAPAPRTRGGASRSIESPARGRRFETPVDIGFHFETGCGFKVLGSTVTAAVSAGARVGVKSADDTLVRVDPGEQAANVLLQLADGTGVLLPAVREFVTVVSVEEGEVVDVAFEPAAGRGEFDAFARNAATLRELREVVSEAARDNAFRLDQALGDLLDSHMRYDGHLDPALALYAAYAFHEMQRRDRVEELAGALEGDLHVRFFDLDLLSRRIDPQGHGAAAAPAHWPPMPMLARGWTLLSAFRVKLAEPLAGIERHLMPSLWTHFDRAGTEQLRDLILARRLP